MSGDRRVCLVTGAGGRLGTAFCLAAASSYDVVAVAHSRTPQLVSQGARLVDPLAPDAPLADNEHPVHQVRADLTCADDVARVVEVALARFGRIDLVLNAIGASERGPVLDDRRFAASLERQFAVNVLAPVRLVTEVARSYWQDRAVNNAEQRRNVVNVSSTAGLYVYPGLGQAGYGITKAALNFLTLHLADELAGMGVRANAVAPNTFPGLVPTERVLAAIDRLDRGTMTGQILVVDGDEDQLW